MRKRTIAAIVALPLTIAGCTTTTPNPDQVAIVYDAGPLSDTTFEKCVKPGERYIAGIVDEAYEYPAGQRTFEFAADPNDPEGLERKPYAESGPLTMLTKDPLEMRVSGVVTFTLATDCETLTKFHEQVGLKFQAWTEEGWNKLLSVYIAQPLDRALDAASKEFKWRDLAFENPESKQQWEDKVAEYMTKFLQEQGGTAFFSNFAVTLQQPQPPTEVRKAMDKAQQAAEANKAQIAENARAKTELEAIKDLAKVLGPEGAVLWQAIKDGKVSMIISDGKVAVSPPSKNQ